MMTESQKFHTCGRLRAHKSSHIVDDPLASAWHLLSSFRRQGWSLSVTDDQHHVLELSFDVHL